MATSDEVWARGCPPRSSTNRVHVCTTRIGRDAFAKLLRECEMEATFSPLPSDGLEPQKAFEQELHDLEKASLLVADVDVAPCSFLFCVGYAVARGKSIMALGKAVSADFRIAQTAFVVDDLAMLEKSLRAYKAW